MLVLAFATLKGATAQPAPETLPAQPADKSCYWLLNPTPNALLRPFSPDRPNKTEGPYTVDAGHYQVEMDVANFTRDADPAPRTDLVGAGWMNLKAGLCNRADFQLLINSYSYLRTVREGGARIQQGFGDILTRLKVNFWGDDGGSTASGVIPWLEFPTSQDQLGSQGVQTGIIFPLAVQLPDDFNLALMTTFAFVRDDEGRAYHQEYANSICLSHALIGRLGGYVEFYALVGTEPGSEWQGTADIGLTYGLTESVQIDTGANFGVTRAAPDLNLFAGLAFRF